jgi:uncharacterized membrane protein
LPLHDKFDVIVTFSDLLLLTPISPFIITASHERKFKIHRRIGGRSQGCFAGAFLGMMLIVVSFMPCLLFMTTLLSHKTQI